MGFLDNKMKIQPTSKLLQDIEGMDWCVRARKTALKSIEAKGWSHIMEDLITKKRNKIKKKKKLTTKEKMSKKTKLVLEDFDSDEDFDMQDANRRY